MKRILFLVVISLIAISCLIQAQDKKTKGYSVDSNSNIIIDEYVKGGTGNQLNSNKVYQVIEQMPQFPGGEQELFKFINKNNKYTITEPCIQGKVICRFIVNRDGSVSNPEVIRSLDPACDKESIRVIKLLPKFIPGKQNGQVVNCWYTLPVTFKME